tara:strand:+ start:202 stop:1248 length:1047 start_codon:yes stop_codon:yes gene_type:complete
MTPKNADIFECEYCDFTCFKLSDWNRHITTAKHINRTKNTQKNAEKFECKLCDYKGNKQRDIDRHYLTAKHINRTKNTPKNAEKFECDCGKTYKARSGLWNHKKKCDFYKNIQDDMLEPEPNNSSLTLELLKQNQGFQQILKEQNKMYEKIHEENKQMREQMLEIAKNSGNTSNSHNTNNSHNKFNLNVYLNETCKDAITLNEFIKSIELSTEDFARTGEIGFVKGISHVMVERIRDMEPQNRPIHCTDLKRETVYIKEDEKWEKEDANKSKLRKAVKQIAHKNQQQLYPWQDENPNYEILNTPECEKFFNYSQASLGGYGEEEDTKFENKIMSNVLKEVVIDKKIEP